MKYILFILVSLLLFTSCLPPHYVHAPLITSDIESKGLLVQVGPNFYNNEGDDKWLIKANNYKDLPETYIYIFLV